MNLTLILAISFIISAIIIIITINLVWVYGQVYMEEDSVLICLSAVWTNVSNDVVCKVYNQYDVDRLGTHSIYSDMMAEKDTFDLQLK